MKYLSPLVYLFIFMNSAFAQNGTYNIVDHIEESGREVLITAEIQQLIDRCSQEGGGTIYFPAGEYLTGSLMMKSNTFLHLSAGATLYGSMSMDDYTEEASKSLISSNKADNFGIFGKGMIDGQGSAFWKGKSRPYNRPEKLIWLKYSTNIFFNDIKIINSPNWNIDVSFCDGVWIDGISIISELGSPNSDGIDPVSSKNVFISNCYIETGDDAICPKSRNGIPTENLVVTNCVLISDDSAIKLGTRSEDPIRNAVFSNIIIRNSIYGIALFAKDGGTFENIRFSNIYIETTLNETEDPTRPRGIYPIFVDLERRTPDAKLGAIKNVSFDGITIDTKYGHCLFFGQPDSRLENIKLSNINFTVEEQLPYEGMMKPRGVRNLKDKAANDYAHIESYFSFVHVDGLEINGLTINDQDESPEHTKHMIWGKDVHQVDVSNFKNRSAVTTNQPIIHLEEATNVELSSNSPVSDAAFVSLSGTTTSDVVLMNNNLRKVAEGAILNGVNQDQVIEYNNLYKK
ncbi:MAG: glycosyl hydrolase family 28 protein [Cyclobacteriaceae bacterium]